MMNVMLFCHLIEVLPLVVKATKGDGKYWIFLVNIRS